MVICYAPSLPRGAPTPLPISHPLRQPDSLSLPSQRPGLCPPALNSEGALLWLKLHLTMLSVASRACPAISLGTLSQQCPPPVSPLKSSYRNGSNPSLSKCNKKHPSSLSLGAQPLGGPCYSSPSPTSTGPQSSLSHDPTKPTSTSYSPLPRLEGLPHLTQAYTSVSFRGCSFPTRPPQKRIPGTHGSGTQS